MREECPLLELDKKQDIKITWKGNEECFHKHLHALNAALGDGSMSWKKEGQKVSYPLNVRYKSSYVPFEETLVFKRNALDFTEVVDSCALLHVYFIYATSFDDYRNNIRHNLVSDWFAKLNEAENPNWLIVFDSSRTREKKMRTSVQEKIRSDFSKYLNRLVELNDSTVDRSAFNSVIKSSFLSCLDFHSDFLTNSILKCKELAGVQGEVSTFHPSLLVNIQFKLSRFYWNLGLIENALRELDKLDTFLSGLIWDLSLEDTHRDAHKTGTACKWLKQIKLLPFGQQCPLLGASMRLDCTTDQFPLVHWRCFILAHQVLLTFHMFHQRLELIEHESEEEEAFTKKEANEKNLKKVSEEICQQLRWNFVSFILRYTHDCLMRITEEVIVLKANYSPALLYILSLVWHAEVFKLCDYLADVLEVENASYYICQMTYIHCNAVLNLLPLLSTPSNECTLARRWLESTQTDNLGAPSADVFGQLCKVLLSADTSPSFGSFAKGSLKKSVHIFRIFKWHRHSELFNSKLAGLVKNDEKEAAFHCLKENADNHFSGNSKSTEFMVEYASQLMEHYADFLEENEFTVSCYLILFLSKINGSSGRYKDRLLALLDKLALNNQHIYRSNLDWRWPLPLPVHVHHIAEHLLLYVLNSSIRLEVELDSDFPASLPPCQVKAVFRPVNVDLLQPLQPTFYSSTIIDNICRFACVSKGGGGKPLGSQEGSLVLTADCSLCSGVTKVQLQGKASVPGCFALDHLEVVIAKALTFNLHYQKEMVGKSRLKNVLCLVDIKKPWVVMETDPNAVNTQFLAGVVQKLCFRVHTGTIAREGPSTLKVGLVGLKHLMEFLTKDGSWEKKLRVEVSQLNADQSQLVEVFMCLAIDRMNFSADQSSLLHYEIQVDWVGRSWHFPLTFLPIVSLRSMTSLLGDSVLFELDIQRCDTNTVLKLVPTQATLCQDQSLTKEPVEARLMNSLPFQPLLANSSYRIVWTLPSSKIGKSIPIVHYLQLDYKMEVDEESCSGQEHYQMPLKHITQRQYSFENKLSFAVHKVEYEVCAQVLSERPQSVLCRIDLQCDLIVSLRSLTNKAESIIVVVEIDPHYWLAVDRFKVVNVKESGVGQTNFTIIPKKVGFLPYPSLFIHQHLDSNDRRSFSEQTIFGERLTCFYRNQGKQIHVLGPLLHSDDTSSSGSGPVKKSFKSQAKDRIQKLFE